MKPLAELLELLRYRLDQVDSVAPAAQLPFLCPLTLHARYTRDEIWLLSVTGPATRRRTCGKVCSTCQPLRVGQEPYNLSALLFWTMLTGLLHQEVRPSRLARNLKAHVQAGKLLVRSGDPIPEQSVDPAVGNSSLLTHP